jgi:hypothetical protein
VSELDRIGCELYNLGSCWIFLLWIMDVDPFPRIPTSLPAARKSTVKGVLRLPNRILEVRSTP